MTTAANALGIWGIKKISLGTVEEEIQRGAEAWLYETLLPSAYGQIQITLPEGKEASLADLRELRCKKFEQREELHGYSCPEPFRATPAGSVLVTPPTLSSGSDHLLVVANAAPESV
jgi:hypothetical protein